MPYFDSRRTLAAQRYSDGGTRLPGAAASASLARASTRPSLLLQTHSLLAAHGSRNHHEQETSLVDESCAPIGQWRPLATGMGKSI
jgi:hypothetical protein